MNTALRRIYARAYVTGSGCLETTYCGDGRGYAQIRLDGKLRRVYRVLWEELEGPVPRGLELDHLCRNRARVAPAHLEPVTHAENVRRGAGGDHQTRKDACPQGHLYDAANTYLHEGRRYCRECHRSHSRAYSAKRRAPNCDND